MNLQRLALLLSVIPILSHCSSQTEDSNVSDSISDSAEWIVLFDGSNTDHWRGYHSDSFPETGWSVQDSMLVFEPTDNDGAEGGHNIITRDKFENFHLQLEWKIEKGSNSGIFYGVLEQDGIDIYWSGPEYQILDPAIFSELNDENLKRITGALYDLVEPEPKNMNPIGEWNSTEIIVDGPMLTHRLNGETVVEIERWTPEWFELVRNSKFATHNEFANVRRGHIGIQDHGGTVLFKNIRIKEL